MECLSSNKNLFACLPAIGLTSPPSWCHPTTILVSCLVYLSLSRARGPLLLRRTRGGSHVTRAPCRRPGLCPSLSRKSSWTATTPWPPPPRCRLVRLMSPLCFTLLHFTFIETAHCIVRACCRMFAVSLAHGGIFLCRLQQGISGEVSAWKPIAPLPAWWPGWWGSGEKRVWLTATMF